MTTGDALVKQNDFAKGEQRSQGGTRTRGDVGAHLVAARRPGLCAPDPRRTMLFRDQTSRNLRGKRGSSLNWPGNLIERRNTVINPVRLAVEHQCAQFRRGKI